jgi:hypothetical protein
MRTSDSERDEGDSGFGRRLWRARGRLLWLGLAGAASVAAVSAFGACSLIVDTNDNQCAATSDCDTLFPGEGRTCVSGVCTAPTGAACTSDSGPCCSVNADCSGMGQYYVCRKTACVSLVSDLCTTVYTTKQSDPATAYEDDTAVIIGDILPTAANSDGPYGHLVEDSIKLAMDDLSKADGIPGLTGGSNRPLVLVGCNDGVNEDQTDIAAQHLIGDLGVPAIIGYAFSGNTISVAQDETIPNKVLLFSPSATAVAITDLETTDDDLVWRTCPNDNVQSQALALLFPDVVQAVSNRYKMVDPTHLKVAVVNHSDAYGSGLASAIAPTLSFNGKMATDPTNDGCAADSGTGGPTDPTACYFNVDYGPSTNPDLGAIPIIAAFAPDIIFLFGFNEGPDVIFKQVEAQWTLPPDGHRPFWIMSDGDQVTSLWATHPDGTNPNQMDPADISTEDQRQRVIGSVPGTNATSWPPYGTFLSEFAGSSYAAADGSADTIGPAGAYDILFLLAYSTVMVGTNELTGPNLVKLGLQKMQKTSGLPNLQISNQTSNILGAFPPLAGDTPINVTGVSGPLPFNGKGDITTADIQIWCVPPSTPPDMDVGGTAINSGFYFDSQTSALAGCLSTTCNLPNYPAQDCQ